MIANVVILKVIQGAICGSTSVTSSSGRSSGVKADKWGVDAVTPGLLAFAAVLVTCLTHSPPFTHLIIRPQLVYLTSGDTTFKGRDEDSTAIEWDYPLFFNMYLKKILASLHLPGMQALFKWLNQQIFGTSAGSALSRAVSSGVNRDTVEQNRAIEDDFGAEIPPEELLPPAAPLAPLPPRATTSLLPSPIAPAIVRRNTAPLPDTPSTAPVASGSNSAQDNALEPVRSSHPSSSHPSGPHSTSSTPGSSTPQLPESDLVPEEDSQHTQAVRGGSRGKKRAVTTRQTPPVTRVTRRTNAQAQ